MRPDPALDDERRRYYRLTERGRAVAVAEARRWPTPWRRPAPPWERSDGALAVPDDAARLPEEFRDGYAREMARTLSDEAQESRHSGSRWRWSACGSRPWPTWRKRHPASTSTSCGATCALRPGRCSPVRPNPDRRGHAGDRYRRQRGDVRGRRRRAARAARLSRRRSTGGGGGDEAGRRPVNLGTVVRRSEEPGAQRQPPGGGHPVDRDLQRRRPDAERVNAIRVSRGYFDMVGVQPRPGRAFTDAEDMPGAARRW